MKPRRTRILATVALSILSAAAASASEGDAALEPLLATCAQCHGPDFGGRQQRMAPMLAGLGAWYLERQLRNFRDGIRGTDPGDGFGMQMSFVATMFGSDEDIRRVAELVEAAEPGAAAPTIDGDVEKGGKLYASCGACHGLQGEGNEETNSPRLTSQNDWYLAAQLRNFRTGRRGSQIGDSDGQAMATASLTLTSDEAIDDVVAYINTLDWPASE